MERKSTNTSDIKPVDAKKGGFMDKAGEALEHVGKKISDMGAPSVGKAVHDLGDKVEKTHDNKRPGGREL
jgi:hypothetical protein